MNIDLYILVPILAILIVISAFFSGSETALLGFDWLRLRYLARKGDKRAKKLEKILARKDRLIGTILVGNNIANVASSAIATAVAIKLWGNEGIVYATGTMTLLLLIFAEIAPKTFASQHAEKVGLLVAPFFGLLSKLFFPVVIFVTTLSSYLLKLLGTNPSTEVEPTLSEEEIRTMLSDSRSTANVAENKKKMLHGVFQMSRKIVHEIMTPRTSIHAIDITTSISEATEKFVQTGYTRLPVFDQNMDHMLGMIHARDVLALVGKDNKAGLSPILREAIFVPESMTLEGLLYQFQKKESHMAIVVDEYGGVEGLATLDDVLEEIVGEIKDEHDLEAKDIRFLPGGEVLIKGRTPLGDLNQALGLNLPTDIDVTIGGFMLTKLSHIPKKGESFTFLGVKFTVERTGKNKVTFVKVSPGEEE
jgi:putative hemolysin